MDEVTANLLQKAYALIKAGQKQAATDILIPIVRANPNLADAWFLRGHAVTEPQKRIQCFQQVLRINPANQSAQRQLAQLLVSPTVSLSWRKPSPEGISEAGSTDGPM